MEREALLHRDLSTLLSDAAWLRHYGGPGSAKLPAVGKRTNIVPRPMGMYLPIFQLFRRRAGICWLGQDAICLLKLASRCPMRSQQIMQHPPHHLHEITCPHVLPLHGMQRRRRFVWKVPPC